jgi:glycerol-3-phosphate O-acyltransferase/dihydroxyacetone phosphate acyltransferase
LVDLFATSSNERITALRTLLVTYSRLLTTSRLSNAALTDLPLPQNLDPKSPISLPNRFFAVYLLVKDTLIALIRLPFFLVPLLTHLPVYVVGALGSRLAEDEMETQAQMKIAFGILLTLLTYPVLFFSFWAMFRQLPLASAIAAGVVWILSRHHAALIDDNYDG